MPQAGAIRAGRAFVELFADDSKLVRGLKRAQAKLMAFGQPTGDCGCRSLSASASIPGTPVGVPALDSSDQSGASPAKRTKPVAPRALYETGQQNIIVLLDAQEALIEHQRGYVDALRDCANTIVDLELAVGGPFDSLEDKPVDNTNERRQP